MKSSIKGKSNTNKPTIVLEESSSPESEQIGVELGSETNINTKTGMEEGIEFNPFKSSNTNIMSENPEQESESESESSEIIIPKKTIVVESDTETPSSSSSSSSSNSNSNNSDYSSTNNETQSLENSTEQLKIDFDNLKTDDPNSKEYNKFLLKKELMEHNYLKRNESEDTFLYPNLNDPNFNVKIAKKKEFNDTKYNGELDEDLTVEEKADILSKADFELAPQQAFVRNFMSFQTPYNSLLLYHGLGSGKCHLKGTQIMLYDGTIKNVEDINVNDFLMGDDSTPRRVISLAKGRDKMYDIKSIKGDKYTVNSEHILCLKASGFPNITVNNNNSNTNYNIQWIENNVFKSKTFTFSKKLENQEKIKKEAEDFFSEIKNNNKTNNNIIEISVNDYLKLSNKKKGFLKGYKVPINFNEQVLPFDPYVLGYWLGDGSSNDSKITSQDSTVLHYLNIKLKDYKLTLNYLDKYDYRITGNGKYGGNIFLTTLKDLKLINNKHIPQIYKCNSRENRLKLLAGLIDSDGYLDKTKSGFEFTNKNEQLIDDVIYLARSLGFSCYKSLKKTSWTYENIKKNGFAWRICINGLGIEDIPTLIPRKKSYPRKQIKDALVYGINVEYLREDDYYGFTLDGNCRYVMGDFSVTHNTYSSIGICEEMREYLKTLGISKRIIIVASPNVQDNFRTQLFDDRKLELIDGVWTIKGAGSKFLKEINPMNMKGLSKQKIISQVKSLINNSYMFLGYDSFANYIKKIEGGIRDNPELSRTTKSEKKTKFIVDEMSERIRENLNKEFNNRLIVIDEVHNIRITDDNENKKVAIYLSRLVDSVDNLRLLLLSATPMYNSYKEIVYLLNLMNASDKRAKIEVKQVFKKNGEFQKGGEDLLIRKATGYVSFVRGENPFTFPYKAYPKLFSPSHSFGRDISYPIYQMNGKPIEDTQSLKILDVFLTKIGSYQSLGYRYIIDSLRRKKIQITTKKGVVRVMPSFDNMEAFGYTLLEPPLESLIIVYPYKGLEDFVEEYVEPIEEIEVIEERKIPEVIEEEIASKKSNVDYESEVEEAQEERMYDDEEKQESVLEEEKLYKDESTKAFELGKQESESGLKSESKSEYKYGENKNEFDIVEVKPDIILDEEEEGEKDDTASIEVERNIEQLKSITKDLVSLAQSLREESESNKTLLDVQESSKDIPSEKTLLDVDTQKSSKDIHSEKTLLDVDTQKSSKDIPSEKTLLDIDTQKSSKDIPSEKTLLDIQESLKTSSREKVIDLLPVVERLEKVVERLDEKIPEKLRETLQKQSRQKTLTFTEPEKPKSLLEQSRQKSALDSNVVCASKIENEKNICEDKIKILQDENLKYKQRLNELKKNIKAIAEQDATSFKGGDDSTKRSSLSASSNSNSYTNEIDPHKLIGKKGLRRIMSFVESTSPPQKSSFEYKPEYEHLRMFSPDNIGKYSSKIKYIVELIKKSKGVILVYSRYIDSGLVPLALALEELGLTRYGNNTKNLFKNQPTEPLDVRTMLPREKGTKDFIPARYSMITGDPSISPDNNFEVKGLTDSDNKNGYKVKVVLISQAGSEGIDLKFIRQVHILDPWYNMNRISQIEGRAVRNFSHKDLPFEERNVEIFMHATILQDKKEEAADLYVYRCAEQKAKQIGRVTRLLKENSVDCILNYQQTNFTQKNFEKYLKEKHESVKQILSTGQVIDDFKIGDAPFSQACDYMETCEYKCRGDVEITDKDIDNNTYNETFIMMNADKIIQKIRNLFSDPENGKFFFKKDNLIKQLTTVKNYPLVQIYAALTQLIDDKNEYLLDKYGRTGRLVNIGDYYLFQPVELDNKNISIFDRSVPIDYKRSMINIEIKDSLKKASEDLELEPTKKFILEDSDEEEETIKKTTKKKTVVEEEGSEGEEEVISKKSKVTTTTTETKNLSARQVKEIEKGLKVFEEMNIKFNLARKYTKEKSVPRGDKDENVWYKYCGLVIRKLATEEKIPIEDLLIFLVRHIVDMLVYHEKVELLNYLYSLNTITDKSLEEYALDYLDSKIIKNKNLTAIPFNTVSKREILILNQKTNLWEKAEPEDALSINEILNSREKPDNLNNLIGFVDYEVKTGKFMVFKVKNMLEKRHTGARCDNAGKKDTIELLNKIFGENKYTKENTKSVVQEELCCTQEFILRYYNNIEKDDKIYFLDTETAKSYGF